MTAIAKLFWTISGLLFFGYIAFFAIANDIIISVVLLPQSEPVTAPLWLAILISFAAGIILISLIASVRVSALRIKTYRLEKRLSSYQAQQADTQSEMLDHKEGA